MQTRQWRSAMSPEGPEDLLIFHTGVPRREPAGLQDGEVVPQGLWDLTLPRWIDRFASLLSNATKLQASTVQSCKPAAKIRAARSTTRRDSYAQAHTLGFLHVDGGTSLAARR